MPKTLAAFKASERWVLERHIGRTQALQPDAKPDGHHKCAGWLRRLGGMSVGRSAPELLAADACSLRCSPAPSNRLPVTRCCVCLRACLPACLPAGVSPTTGAPTWPSATPPSSGAAWASR